MILAGAEPREEQKPPASAAGARQRVPGCQLGSELSNVSFIIGGGVKSEVAECARGKIFQLG